MLDEEICKLRERLNESILTGKKYNEIYSLSVKLDELIAKHYLNEVNYADADIDEDEEKKVI